MTSPRIMALRFRIWAFCKPREWDVTIEEIADALDISKHVIRGTLIAAGWNNRVRPAPKCTSMSSYEARHVHVSERVAQDVVAGRIGVAIDA